jgi:hypothetical protein
MTTDFEWLPEADPNITVSEELHMRILTDFVNFHRERAERRHRRNRIIALAFAGLVLVAWFRMWAHHHWADEARLPEWAGQNEPHKGVPPSPRRYFTPPPRQEPAIDRLQRYDYGRHPRAMPQDPNNPPIEF